MSQLAYIFTGLGSALWLANNGYDDLAAFAMGASLFHLFNHAMAKECCSWHPVQSFTKCIMLTTK